MPLCATCRHEKKKVRRGRKRKYGLGRISLAKRAARREHWRAVTCLVYGVEVVKSVKTFLATLRWPMTGGFRAGLVYAASAGAFSASNWSGDR